MFDVKMPDIELEGRVQEWLAYGVAEIQSVHKEELNDTAAALLTAAVLAQRGEVDAAIEVVQESSPNGLGLAIEDVARVMRGEDPKIIRLNEESEAPGENALGLITIGEVPTVVIPGQVRDAQVIALEGGTGRGRLISCL